MKTLAVIAFVLTLSLAPALAAQSPADAVAVPPAPLTDLFEDGAQRLRVVGLPSRDGASLQLTLVYEDSDRRLSRSVTVEASKIAPKTAPELRTFLADVDPDFASFVRASIADRILHLSADATPFERAESSLFFPSAPRAGAVARRASRESAGLD